MTNNTTITILLLIILSQSSLYCKKYLETKSVQTLSTPSTLEDLQLLLDNSDLTTAVNITNTSSDEYYLKYTDWQPLSIIQKRAYVWDPVLNNPTDWISLYKYVNYANNVLFNLETIDSEGQESKANAIKGGALFIRAHCFYHIAQLYATQFDPLTAGKDLGIPLRLNADFNEPSVRSTVKQTYDQIIKDLTEAAALLPEKSLYKTRPDKAAAYALLARVYNQVYNYAMALTSASLSLQHSNTLIDLNQENVTAPFPFLNVTANPEILYYWATSAPVNIRMGVAKIDSALYDSFDADDLRKQAYFKSNGNGTYSFKGNYTGKSSLFNGIAVDEVYLIKAEANARLGNTAKALEDLNTLLSKKWKSDKFTPLTASTPLEALQIILTERKKELIYRATRWPDLKRLNKDPQFATEIRRELNGQIYSLKPNDLRYALLIPQEILNRVNLPQNPR